MQNLYLKKSPVPLLTGLTLVWSVVVAICCVFTANINRVTSEEVDRYLLEISSGVSSSVNARIATVFTILTSVGRSYLELQTRDPYFALEYLKEKSESHGFKKITVTDLQGRTVSSDGQPMTLADFPNLARVFAGQTLFLRIRHSPGDDADGVLYAKPLYLKGKISGIIVAWNDVEHIQRYLREPFFGDKGHFHILDLNGNVLLGPPDEDLSLVPNYLDLLLHKAEMTRGSAYDMRKNMRTGASGRLDFVLDGCARTAAYVPLRNEELYLVAVAPSEVAWEQFRNMTAQTLLLVLAIVALFTGLILLLFFKDRNATKKLVSIAFVDPVTGGMTRNRFKLEALPKIAAAPRGAYSLVSVNIAQFKLVNDILGSETGDLLLRQLHDCIKEHLTKDELICRDYADDFVLLVATKSRERTLLIVDSISAKVNRLLAEADFKYKLRLYLGVYEIDDKSLPLVSLLDRANIARKNSRSSVRGQLYECVFYSDLERQQMIKSKDIENKMEEALNNGDFIVYLQPKIELQDKTVVGAEALVRWQDKDTGIIPPGDFISCFETNGFIIKLDLHIFEQTCRIVRGWLDSGVEPVPVSVNLSRAHLIDQDFLLDYTAVRDRYGIPHGLLEIELTESLLSENFVDLQNLVERLHESGFKCSLDDFGSGYSSLNMLKDIQVDTLKLDGAFWVSPDAANQREKDIITAVVELARKLGMTTVSEGVETAEQLEFLRQIRCDMVQGFVFSRPVPPEEFEEIAFGRRVSGKAG